MFMSLIPSYDVEFFLVGDDSIVLNASQDDLHAVVRTLLQSGFDSAIVISKHDPFGQNYSIKCGGEENNGE